MPDLLSLNLETKTKYQTKIFILFGISIAIYLIAIGFNIQQELKLSDNRIGAEILIKDNKAFIVRTISGGPAFKAGIKSDSYIVSINNEPIRNFFELDSVLNSDDSELNIIIFKNGISSTHKLDKGRPPELRQIFTKVLISALFLLLAYISIPSKGNKNSTRNLLIILLFLFMGLEYILVPFRGHLHITTGLTYFTVVSGLALAAITGGFTLALELHILCITPKPRPWFIKNKNAILASFYFISVYFTLVVAFFYLNYLPQGTFGTLFSWLVWSLINILWCSLIIIILFTQFISTKSPREKNLLIIIFASMLPFVIITLLMEWYYLIDVVEPEWVYPFEVFASFSFPIGFMIAVKRYDLADIGHDIQRPLVFKFVAALIVFYLINSLYSSFLRIGNFDIIHILYFGIGSLFIGMLWFPLAHLLNHWASNPWQSDPETSNPTLQNTLDSILAYSDNNRVVQNLPRLLNDSLHSNWVALSLKENSDTPYFHYEQNTDKTLPADLLETELTSLFYEQNNFDQPDNSATEATSLFELGATNILPLIYRDEILGGIVLAQSSEHYIIPNKALNIFSDQLAEIIFTNKLRHQATIDGLTKILRRESVLEKLHFELTRYRKTGEEISVCLLDLDHFKQVNDSYGHAAGDEVLKQLAALLKDQLRNTDIVGRYGGEEFLIILPKTEVAEAKIQLESLRHAIHDNPVKIAEGHTINISVSIGLSSTDNLQNCIDHSLSDLIQKLIHEADIALYQAKETGRNKIVIAVDTTPH